MEAAVGAEPYPSGDHVWNGKTAEMTPKPRNKSGNQNFWKDNEKPVWARSPKMRISNVWTLEVKYMAKNPTSMNADPARSIKVNFMAAYSLRPAPQIPTNRYMGRTANS